MGLKIIEIVRDVKTLAIPCVFRVGERAFPAGPNVSEILYCRDGYSTGSKGKWPAYAVKFEESNEVRIIPESTIIDMIVVSEEPTKSKKDVGKTEADIALPE